MSKVIKGVFPESVRPANKKEAKEKKPLASYVLHISITFSDPLIWRRVQVPGSFTLSQLHDIIQMSMGWSDCHVHQFLVGKISYEPTQKSNLPRESKRFDEHKYQLYSLEEGMRFMFSYIYDAGEGWEHEIHLEEVVPPKRQLDHPILLAGEMACPPETVGDIHEYNQLLSSPKDLSELAGSSNYDPTFFDLDAAKKRLNRGHSR